MLRIEITGTAIFSDLLAKAVRDEYNGLLGVGISFEDAEAFIIEAFCGGKSFSEGHESVFWLSLACTEHKYGALSEKVKERALYAIDSGEDIRKWENAAKYAPYYRYISSIDNEDKNFKILCEIAERKYAEKPADCTEEGFYEFQVNMIKKLIKDYPVYKKLMPAKLGGKSPKPVEHPGIEPDEFFRQINMIGGGCEKKLAARKKILAETREYLATPQPPKKPKKISSVKCPWEAGDVVAVKTHSAEKRFPGLYEDGKYILLLILKVKKEPVGQLIPMDVAAEESAVMGFYDYYGDDIPGEKGLEKIPFIKVPGPFGSVHTAHSVYFKYNVNFLKKTEWRVIKHYEGFPENIPGFFKDGVMTGSLMGFDETVFYFVPQKRKSGKYETGF